ncbi:hypothetical protein [Acidovorax sp. NCPPB 3576]|uniref:hypothetical protein n=1 Tax=Acidovorax sp. NCPPB 3576 TaxID=2940488 RepID=UPI00234A82BA|nr:hypothetical protein [Acidovorax sp. NCPPB 3576]WCM90338.1 hypothetical protein M5C98_10125 [Acidovorax sp. NCPPB 3576]
MVACSATALSLGASRGAVVLGAPVDLVFEIQPDPGTDVESSCVAARLVSGETPVPDSRVRVTPIPASAGRSPAVRVQANVSADEPILTATLTAGCRGGVTRNYTFFAQLPEAAAGASRPVDLGQWARPSTAASPGAGLAGDGAGATSVGRSSAATDSAPRRPAAAPRPPRAPAATAMAPRANAAPAAPGTGRAAFAPPQQPVPPERPRLVMEPLDVWLDAPLPLRSAPEMAAPTATDSSPQRTEAAALWKALNTPVEELQQSAARTGKLEAEVAAQRAQATSERAAAAQLKQQLQAAESERFSSTVVYGLLALLALALGLAAWIWARARRQSSLGWNHAVAASGGMEPVPAGVMDGPTGRESLQTAPQSADDWSSLPAPVAHATPVAVPMPVPVPVPAPVPAPAKVTPRGATLPERAPPPVMRRTEPSLRSAPAPLAPPVPPAPVPPVPVVPPPLAAVRAAPIVHPEELFDIQQQADFFVSVGEHDQAIGVLKRHIAEHGETSPFAYLELLRLYHTLSRVESFNQLRAQFQAQFNAQVPEFSSFHKTGLTLESYTEALAAIEAEWSSPAVLETLEGCLFRRGEDAIASPFDLAAYDDLLLLLAIAQTTPASARGAPPPRARTTPLTPPPEEVVPAPAPVATAPGAFGVDSPAVRREQELQSLDSLSAGFSWESIPAPLAAKPISEAMLDIDLTDPPPLTLSELPPVPVTEPPPAGQPIGFGMDNDKMELRLELEELERKQRTDK